MSLIINFSHLPPAPPNFLMLINGTLSFAALKAQE